MRRFKLCYTFFADEPETQGEENKKPEEANNSDRKFTQQELNEILAKERKRHEDRTKTQIKELEILKQSSGLAQQEKEKLTVQIEELRNSLLSKEQLAKEKEKKLAKQAEEEKKILESERDQWRDRFTTSTILREITDAAHSYNAFNPSQIIALLKPQTKLEAVTDEDGKVLDYKSVVDYEDVGPNGENIKVKMPITDAVKRMTEQPEKYGNLFKNTARGGLGGSPSVDPTRINFTNMTQEQYKAARPVLLGKGQ